MADIRFAICFIVQERAEAGPWPSEKITTLSSQTCSVLQLPDRQPPVCMHTEKTHRLEAGLYVSATATERLFQMAPAGAFPIRPVNNHRRPPGLPHKWHKPLLFSFHCQTWKDPSHSLKQLDFYHVSVVMELFRFIYKAAVVIWQLKNKLEAKQKHGTFLTGRWIEKRLKKKKKKSFVPCCPVWACQFPLSACSKSRSYYTGGRSSCWAGLHSSSSS